MLLTVTLSLVLRLQQPEAAERQVGFDIELLILSPLLMLQQSEDVARGRVGDG